MKLGILRTGTPPDGLVAAHGTYPDMFERLLGPQTYTYRTWAVDAGEWPDGPGSADAYLITGSSAGVYDPEPWIPELIGFLQGVRGKVPLLGVCFGHQVMAEAFGGKVVKSPKGWGIGAHDYEVTGRQPWMEPVAAIRLPASHQDQVVDKPAAAEVIAASDFTPFGALAYPDDRAASIQLHPEFEPAYAIDLIEARRERASPTTRPTPASPAIRPPTTAPGSADGCDGSSKPPDRPATAKPRCGLSTA